MLRDTLCNHGHEEIVVSVGELGWLHDAVAESLSLGPQDRRCPDELDASGTLDHWSIARGLALRGLGFSAWLPFVSVSMQALLALRQS